MPKHIRPILGSVLGNVLTDMLRYVSGDELTWLLLDNFNGTLAAGDVNGTLSDSGAVRTVVDTENKLSIGSGVLSFAGGKASPGFGDPALYLSAVTRVAGRMLIANFNQPTASKYSAVAWDVDKTGDPGPYRFGRFDSGTYFSLTSINVAAFATGNYKVALPLRSTGAFLFTNKDGAGWRLLYVSITDATATLYPGFVNYNDIFTSSFLRIPVTLWLPTPLLSTSGAMTWPVTDGKGHAEQTGLGAGGSGLTMLDVGTWSVAGGYVLNTPVAGVEKVSDVGFDSAAAWAVVPASWDIGVTTLGKATKIASAGTESLVNSGGLSGVAGMWYAQTCDIAITAGQVFFRVGGSLTSGFTGTSTVVATSRAVDSTSKTTIYGAASLVGSFDNFSTKPLPISQLITNCQLTTTDVLAEQIIHAFTLGSQVGLVQADRSFAAKAAATAAAGQAVLSLKEVTGVGSGTELITNGTFESATTGWTLVHATGDIEAGGYNGNCVKLTEDTTYGYAWQAISTVVGQKYTISYAFKKGTGTSASVYAGTSSGGNDLSTSGALTNTGWEAKNLIFTATGTTTYITIIMSGSAGQTAYFDSVSTKIGGLTIADTITIAGTTYTISAVTGAGTVAYSDSAKTQTVVLGSNLGAEVLADAKVGLDWAAWNGFLTYFDGAGNIKCDEIKAGVYTNRGSTAVTFSADKRLIVRKIGSEVRIFFNEALVGTAISTIDAAALTNSRYSGIFSTLAANTTTSMVVYDTGNVTNSYSILDRYSKDQ